MTSTNGTRKPAGNAKDKFPAFIGTPTTKTMKKALQRLANKKTDGNLAQLSRYIFGRFIDESISERAPAYPSR